MKKADIINCILEMNKNVPKLHLTKMKKNELQIIYDTLLQGEDVGDLLTSNKKKVEKKEVKIIDFSSDEEEDDTEPIDDVSDMEQLPPSDPVLKRQDAMCFKKTEADYKKELRHMTRGFTADVKQITTEFRSHKDTNTLLHEYEIVVRDTEDMLNDYLTKINASDDLYNYVADILDISNRFIERLSS